MNYLLFVFNFPRVTTVAMPSRGADPRPLLCCEAPLGQWLDKAVVLGHQKQMPGEKVLTGRAGSLLLGLPLISPAAHRPTGRACPQEGPPRFRLLSRLFRVMFRVLKSSHAPSHPPAALWGGPSVWQGEVGGWVWEVMAVGGLWMQGEVAELPGNNPCIGNRMIRNVQLFVGHSDLLPGQVTHVLLPAIQARGNWIADALLRLFLGSRQNSIPTHLILCHTYVQSLSLC